MAPSNQSGMSVSRLLLAKQTRYARLEIFRSDPRADLIVTLS